MTALTEREYRVPVRVMLSIPDAPSRQRLLALAREAEATDRARAEDRKQRAEARDRQRRKDWHADPWVQDVLLAARLMRARSEAAGHRPGYWSAPCGGCDRMRPGDQRQCRECGRYGNA